MSADAWRNQALCAQVGPDLFFPSRGGSTKAARKICANCEVRPECLDDAVNAGPRHGVWAGLTERQLRKLIHQRADQAA